MEKLVIVTILISLIPFSIGNDVENNCPEALASFTDQLIYTSSKFLKYNSNYTKANNAYETWIASPLATMFNIATLALFAEGSTKDQTCAALNLTTREEIVCVMNYLTYEEHLIPDCMKYSRVSNYYGNISLPFTSEFISNITEIIEGYADNVDFSKPSQAGSEINNYVASQSNNTITDIVEDSSVLDASSQIILVTGMYLMGAWQIEFQETNKVNKFKVSPSKVVPQTFLYQDATYKYAHSKILGARVVQIEMCCQTFHAWIVLPDIPFTVDDVIDKMVEGNDWYYNVKKNMKPTEIKCYVPEYDMTTNLVDVQDVFIQNTTGIGIVFDEESVNLKGVIENDPVAVISTCISKTLQRMSYDGEGPPDRSQSQGKKKTFKANYPHIIITFCKNERVYLTGVYRGPCS